MPSDSNTSRGESQSQTIQDFGRQWTYYDDVDSGYYASTDLLNDLLTPFLSAGDVRDAKVADIGSGTGRIVRMLVSAGAGHVTAVEPSDAFEVLVSNTRDIADKIEYVQNIGENIPNGQFDLILSMGVIHHIPDPDPTIRSALAALRPGGRILIWVYGKEGNELYLALAGPLRHVTRRLPDPLLRLFCWVLWLPLVIYVSLCRFVPLPMRSYAKNHLVHLSNRQLVTTIFDQLNPAYAKYYTKQEAIDLLERAGAEQVAAHHRHGYSWTVCGCKAI